MQMLKQAAAVVEEEEEGKGFKGATFPPPAPDLSILSTLSTAHFSWPCPQTQPVCP
jgi:hypothetical protein